MAAAQQRVPPHVAASRTTSLSDSLRTATAARVPGRGGETSDGGSEAFAFKAVPGTEFRAVYQHLAFTCVVEGKASPARCEF